MAAMSARVIAHRGGSLCGQEGSDFSCRPVGNSSKRLDIAEERLDATDGRGPFGAMAAAWAWMYAGMPACMNASMPAFRWPGRPRLESSHQTLLMQRLNAGSAIASAWIILLINTCRTVTSGMSKSGACSRSRSSRPAFERKGETDAIGRSSDSVGRKFRPGRPEGAGMRCQSAPGVVPDAVLTCALQPAGQDGDCCVARAGAVRMRWRRRRKRWRSHR